MSYVQGMNILSFIGVFKNIMVKWIIGCILKGGAFFSRERDCEEYIFGDIQKKIDFPKVIPDFAVEIACLDEQEQGAGEIDDEAYNEPEIGLLVYKDHLRFVHLVEQVKDRVGNDQDGFHGGGERVETLVIVPNVGKVLGNGKNVKYHRRAEDDHPEYLVVDDRKQ